MKKLNSKKLYNTPRFNEDIIFLGSYGLVDYYYETPYILIGNNDGYAWRFIIPTCRGENLAFDLVEKLRILL
jgi:hypothetical protein